jgi:hypothetical protein
MDDSCEEQCQKAFEDALVREEHERKNGVYKQAIVLNCLLPEVLADFVEMYLSYNGEEKEQNLGEFNVLYYEERPQYVVYESDEDRGQCYYRASPDGVTEWTNVGGPCYLRVLEDKCSQVRRIVMRMRFTYRVLLNFRICGGLLHGHSIHVNEDDTLRNCASARYFGVCDDGISSRWQFEDSSQCEKFCALWRKDNEDNEKLAMTIRKID